MTTASTSDVRVLILHPEDNIAVAARPLPAATEIGFATITITLRDTIDVGHKFALRDIGAGEKIIKYRAPIGHAKRAIRAGEYVHTHNMESDYLPTYTLESEKTPDEEQPS
jgi:hypothetical protein